MAAPLAPAGGSACECTVSKDTDQCPNRNYERKNAAPGKARLKLLEKQKLVFKCVFFTDDCVSSPLRFTSSLVNNSFTSAADISIFPLIMFSGVSRQNAEALISTQ